MVSGGVIAAGLYPLTSAPGLPDDVGTDMRYLTSSRVSASYALRKGCSMAGGVSFHTQLRPDGIRQTVLFNRYAQVFIDFMIAETVLGRIRKVENESANTSVVRARSARLCRLCGGASTYRSSSAVCTRQI